MRQTIFVCLDVSCPTITYSNTGLSLVILHRFGAIYSQAQLLPPKTALDYALIISALLCTTFTNYKALSTVGSVLSSFSCY